MDNNKDLLQSAIDVLKTNDRGTHTVPAADIYPHQWLWDSCFIAIGLSHTDIERAKQEIRSLLAGQWHNGMLPNIIFNDEKRYSNDRNIWRSWLNPNSPDHLSTSGITQPPMLAEAIVRIGDKLSLPERRSWYKETWPALLAYHEWLYKERDPHQEGLVLQIHPWEVGMDNTPPWTTMLRQHLLPAWIRGLQKMHLIGFIEFFRRDTQSVPLDERFDTVEVMALFDVQRRLRRKNYEIDQILDHGMFTIEDLAFNCIFIRANQHLQDIAKVLGVTLDPELVECTKRTKTAFEHLWDEESQQYYSRDFITHHLLRQPTVATLLPLYAGCISKDRAKHLVSMLENDQQYGPAYPVPSVPLSSPNFQPLRYWQGPSWMNINWLLIDGLKRNGFKDHADALAEISVELVEKSGFSEYFDPITGEALGIPNFSWTAALAIDLLKR